MDPVTMGQTFQIKQKKSIIRNLIDLLSKIKIKCHSKCCESSCSSGSTNDSIV